VRNIAEPVEVFAWTLDGQPGGVDPVCGRRVGVPAGRLSYDGREHVFCSLECAGMFAVYPDRYVSQ
jgi:YHS domain-containing protein